METSHQPFKKAHQLITPMMTLRCDVMRSNSNDSKQEFRSENFFLQKMLEISELFLVVYFTFFCNREKCYFVGLEMPKRKITGYVFYMNWNLNNYSTTSTNTDFESFFRMCDRKWSAMSEEEKQQWKTRLRAEEHFEPHRQLFGFLHNLQCEKRYQRRHIPFPQIFQRFENLNASQMERIRRHESSLFLNLLKFSMKQSKLQFSCAFIGVSFSGRTLVTSKFLEIQLLKFTLELGLTEVVGDNFRTQGWSLPSNVEEILDECSYLVCEGTKYSAVVEVMKFIWANEQRLGIPPTLLLMEDFLNTFQLCNEHKNEEEDIILPPLMNCRPREVKLPVNCSYHTKQWTRDFPCALEEAFIALEEIFRKIQNVQPNHFKIGKLLESLEEYRDEHNYPFCSQFMQQDEELPLIEFDEDMHEGARWRETSVPIFGDDELTRKKFYEEIFEGTREVNTNIPFDGVYIKLFDDITPKNFYEEIFEGAQWTETSVPIFGDDEVTPKKFYEEIFEEPTTNGWKEQQPIEGIFPFFDKLIQQYDELSSNNFYKALFEEPAQDPSDEQAEEENDLIVL
ncbi:hypothetical protein T11_14470 [Trichinella zimbabwensis]|uniref:HMG box domain-containing protein n=1 Tax=Trichinella zimbabwensis TaxID=268475 RepID=A0A0V1H9V1_9BILA|nr:hypothetical protein T11_14470 [Trichinella zimbabwensis]